MNRTGRLFRWALVLLVPLLLLSNSAIGEDALRVRVGKGATVEVLPRVRGDIVELVVSNTRVDLDAILNMRSTPQISDMNAIYAGDQVWFVRLALRERDRDAEVFIQDGNLVVEVYERQANTLESSVDPPTVQQLINDDLPEALPPDLPPPFTMLRGSALSLAMDPWRYRPILVPSPPWLPTSSWETVDRARAAMLVAPTESGVTQASYRLGLHYLELGFAKEARYYFGQIADRPGPIPQQDLKLARARAALACGKWNEARKFYREAYRLGAEEAGVVEGLAVVSLATGSPERAPTGRALASLTGRPEALMLAAELLQIDGYYQESRPILEAIHRRLDGEDQARIALRLGDARLHAEVAQDRPTFTESSKAWKRAPEELREIREILVRLLRSDPASMLGEVPRMAQLSNPRSDSGAEALYLLAQVDQILQQDEDAISEFGSWMRRFGSKVKGSDVPERFWTVYSQHVRERAEIGRWFEIAAMHESVWHKTVRRAVRDPEIMYLVARAYDEIGLVDEAMNVMTASIGIKPPEEDANADETIFYMADLQERLALEQMKLGQEKEAEKMFEIALEMLVPLKRSRAKIVSAGQLAMLEARMHEHMGNLDESAVYLRKAARYGEFRDEAQLKLSIMDAEAGRCRQAVPRLEKVLFEVEDPTDDPRPWLALARCLTAQGRGADAARAAQGAAERTSAPEEARYATWLAVVATGWDDEEQIENLVAGDDVWAAMAREQRDAVLFEEELMQRRKTEFTD